MIQGKYSDSCFLRVLQETYPIYKQLICMLLDPIFLIERLELIPFDDTQRICSKTCQMKSIRFSMNYENRSLRNQQMYAKLFEDKQK